MNKVSFKSTFVTPEVLNVGEANLGKLNKLVAPCNKELTTDVIFTADSVGNFKYIVKEAPTMQILKKTKDLKLLSGLDDESANALIDFSDALRTAHRNLWGVKEPFLEVNLGQIDALNPADILTSIKNSIKKFWDMNKNLKN